MDAYGYVRVSAKEQGKDRQMIAMRASSRQRQAEGTAAAKPQNRGKNCESVMDAWSRGEISGRAADKNLLSISRYADWRVFSASLR